MTRWRLKAYVCLATNVFIWKNQHCVQTLRVYWLWIFCSLEACKGTKKTPKKQKETEDGSPQPEQLGTTRQKMLNCGETFQHLKTYLFKQRKWHQSSGPGPSGGRSLNVNKLGEKRIVILELLQYMFAPFGISSYQLPNSQCSALLVIGQEFSALCVYLQPIRAVLPC